MLRKILNILLGLWREFTKQTLFLILTLLLSGAIYVVQTQTFPSFFDTEKTRIYLEKDFNGYKVNIIESKLQAFGKPSLIILANDREYTSQCEDINIKLKKPVMRIYDYNENPLSKLNLFNIPYQKVFDFSPYLKDDSNKELENDLWISDYNLIDLDKDGENEIIVRLIGSACGSGAPVYNFIFGWNENKYRIIETLPSVGYYTKCNPTECNSSSSTYSFLERNNINPDNQDEISWFTDPDEIYNSSDDGESIPINTAHSDNFFEFSDIDENGIYELIFAHPIQGDAECHWCEHYWLVGVYHLSKNGNLVVDNNWNNGLLYYTKEKIRLADGLGYKEIPANVFGSLSPYYFAIDPGEDFYVGGRKTSKITLLVKELYSK